MATHVIGALAAAVDAAKRASVPPFQPPPDMRNAAMLNKAATPIATEGIGRVLSAVASATSVIRVCLGRLPSGQCS